MPLLGTRAKRLNNEPKKASGHRPPSGLPVSDGFGARRCLAVRISKGLSLHEEVRHSILIPHSSLSRSTMEHWLLEQRREPLLPGIGYRHGRAHAREPLGGPGQCGWI